MQIEAIHEVHAKSVDGKTTLKLAPGEIGDVLEKDALYLTRPDVRAAAFLSEDAADAATSKKPRKRAPRTNKSADLLG